MSYSLKKTYFSFKQEVEGLNRIVVDLSAQPTSLERDTHIEGCFIRFVVSWECFCEEYFLRCLCVGKTRSGHEIKPSVSAPRNLNEAFKKININKHDRDKDYLDWLDSTLLKNRIGDYFRANSRVQKLIDAPDRLFEIRVIRNAIAHRSTNAINKFEKFVKDQLGYLSSLNPTMADLLIMKKRGSTRLIFLLLSDYFLDLSERLTK
ncbi:MAG: hypothetical protein KKB74_08525 [Bacteroidetes bacterium]|nr:hypothetical protein [Bacteroidota bacterium]